MQAHISAITYYVPERVVTNQELHRNHPNWDVFRAESKLGIRSRHVAEKDECASDLAFRAATGLLEQCRVSRNDIDCLIFCTQSPDYFLPASACILQHRLGLPATCVAFDFNQGCSGYVYGLYIASGLVRSGMARCALMLTGETYSKYVNAGDRSTMMLFGDGASATLITADPSGALIGEFQLGTDGSGYSNLIVPAGGHRCLPSAETKIERTDDLGNVRSLENLSMNGQEVFMFGLRRVPEVVNGLLQKAQLTSSDVDWFVLHQANAFMNGHLISRLKVPAEKAPLCLERFGNTVSSTIPITLVHHRESLSVGDRVMLVGFGVGYSWGACLVRWGDVLLLPPGGIEQ